MPLTFAGGVWADFNFEAIGDAFLSDILVAGDGFAAGDDFRAGDDFKVVEAFTGGEGFAGAFEPESFSVISSLYELV